MPINKLVVLPHLLPSDDPRYIKWRLSLQNRTPWNKGKTKVTDEGVQRISETFKRRRLDNFYLWRERARKEGIIADANRPLFHNTELAFLIGLILGDGHIGKMERTECLRIVLGTDKPELWKYTAGVINKVFRKKPHVKERNSSRCVNITIYQKNLSERLEIPASARKNLAIKLPEWVWNDKVFLIAAIKGLFEAEGSFSIHLKTYTYNFSFSNMNVSLLDEVQKALELLGFHPERRKNAVRLRKKFETFEFYKLISFRSYNW